MTQREATRTIQALQHKELSVAVELCARAMSDNPIHIRVFGTVPEKRVQRLVRFFTGMLAYVHRKGQLYGAYEKQKLVGVIGLFPPNQCKPSVLDFLRLVPSFMLSTYWFRLGRLARWLIIWAIKDPAQPHWHLGPLAVDPAWQRQGIGSQLLEFACEKGQGDYLYLETDKIENVRFYEKYGFLTLSTPMVLGTPSWLMMRKPSGMG